MTDLPQLRPGQTAITFLTPTQTPLVGLFNITDPPESDRKVPVRLPVIGWASVVTPGRGGHAQQSIQPLFWDTGDNMAQTVAEMESADNVSFVGLEPDRTGDRSSWIWSGGLPGPSA